ARDSPDLLGVGLEEREEEPPAETVGDPVLEGILADVREDLPFQIAQEDPASLPRAQAAERVHRPEWIVKESPAVVDAGQARTPNEVLAERLVPELRDLLDLGEEAVAPDVEVKAAIRFRPREATHRVRLLQQGRNQGEPRELVGGRQAGRPGSDHHRALLSRVLGHHRAGSFDRGIKPIRRTPVTTVTYVSPL